MISREEVVWLYRIVLGRDPESEDAIKFHMGTHLTLEQARESFFGTEEFYLKYRQYPKRGLIYQVGPPSGVFDKNLSPKIALAAIVRDEQCRIADMLTSALPIVSFVSLVDTGSSDNTIAIAKNVLNNNGIPFRIVDTTMKDFSSARNESMEELPRDIDWALILDADEHLVPEDYFFFANMLKIKSVDGWMLPRYNFYDVEKRLPVDPYPDYQTRLLRAHKSIKFQGLVHERATNVNRWGFAPSADERGFAGGPHIHHMGRVALTVSRWTAKHRLYMTLLGLPYGNDDHLPLLKDGTLILG